MTTRERNPMGYTIIDDDDRITVVDATGREICGAYRPQGHEYWSMYVTRLITEMTGLATPPHREHFFGQNGKCVARRWLEMIGALYCTATQQDRCQISPKINGHNVFLQYVGHVDLQLEEDR